MTNFLIRDENSFFDLFVHELDKVEALMEELQNLSEAERNRIVRKKPVLDNNLDVNEKVQQVVQALSEEDELTKSKIAKVYQKPRTKLLSLGIRKHTLNEFLEGQNKLTMDFPKRLGFTATSRMFTLEDSDRMSGRDYTDTFQCSVINLSALNRETREMVMDQLIPNHQKEVMKYNEDEEEGEEDEVGASQDFPGVGQGQGVVKCNLCDYTSASADHLANHMIQEHPLCNACNKRFSTEEALRTHLPSHVRVKCSQCKEMVQKDTLKKHREEHNTMEQFRKEVNKAKIKKHLPKPKQTGKTNPWNSFCKIHRPMVKREHPLYNSDQVRTELQRQWQRLSEDEKAAYKNMEDEEDEALEDADEVEEHGGNGHRAEDGAVEHGGDGHHAEDGAVEGDGRRAEEGGNGHRAEDGAVEHGGDGRDAEDGAVGGDGRRAEDGAEEHGGDGQVFA